MKFFSTKKSDKPNLVVPARVQKTPTPELISWGETSIMFLGKAFDDWRYRDEPFYEVEMLADNVKNILQELANRVDADGKVR